MPSDYFVALFTRDGEKTLPKTLTSLDNQTHRPKYVIAVDDGSTDRTNEILHNGFSKTNKVIVIKSTWTKRDIRHAPFLLNKALDVARDLGMPQYMMVSGDDCVYPTHYAEAALQRMQPKRKLAIASGTWIYDEAPTGSGRFISMDFMKAIGGKYPTFYGWESWLLTKAQQLGYGLEVFHDLHYDHLRDYQSKRVFDWGACMNFMGYPFYSVLHRFLASVALPPSKRQLSNSNLIALIAGYSASRIRKDKPIDDKGFQEYIRYNSTKTLAYAPIGLAGKLIVRLRR